MQMAYDCASRPPDYGAPLSLRMEADRAVRAEELVQHVRALERQARALVKELEADRNVQRESLLAGRAMLKFGCMMLTNAITRDDLL